MWTVSRARTIALEVIELKLWRERQYIMHANATAWTWLLSECQRCIDNTINKLFEDPNATPDDDLEWLGHFVCDVYHAFAWTGTAQITHTEYLPQIPTSTHVVYVARNRLTGNNLARRTKEAVMKALKEWLQFPNNTEMLSGLFAWNLVHVSGNFDILLLPQVWNVYRDIKSKLIDKGKSRSSSLNVSLLDPFLGFIRAHPIADPMSSLSAELRRMSQAILDATTSMTASRSATVQAAAALSYPDHPPVNHNERAPSTLVPALVKRQQRALARLLKFTLELYPLLDTPLPTSLTPLQKLVSSHLDFFLPFREKAPSRKRVTSPGGPFHSTQVDLPGAFSSWAIFRAILFDAPVLLEGHTRGYFASFASWNQLVDAYRAPETRNTDFHKFFFNIHCYGQPQGFKVETFENGMKVYFERESMWNDLVKQYEQEPQGKVPFMAFFKWTQSTAGLGSAPQRRDNVKKLPLIGPLTGYLLAADISYTGKVAQPTTCDIGQAINKIKLGSYKALQDFGFLSGKSPAEAEVVSAFEKVYDYLRANIDRSKRDMMVFDPIMVEHLLCKFHRITSKYPNVVQHIVGVL